MRLLTLATPAPTGFLTCHVSPCSDTAPAARPSSVGRSVEEPQWRVLLARKNLLRKSLPRGVRESGLRGPCWCWTAHLDAAPPTPLASGARHGAGLPRGGHARHPAPPGPRSSGPHAPGRLHHQRRWPHGARPQGTRLHRRLLRGRLNRWGWPCAPCSPDALPSPMFFSVHLANSSPGHPFTSCTPTASGRFTPVTTLRRRCSPSAASHSSTLFLSGRCPPIPHHLCHLIRLIKPSSLGHRGRRASLHVRKVRHRQPGGPLPRAPPREVSSDTPKSKG